MALAQPTLLTFVFALWIKTVQNISSLSILTALNTMAPVSMTATLYMQCMVP